MELSKWGSSFLVGPQLLHSCGLAAWESLIQCESMSTITSTDLYACETGGWITSNSHASKGPPGSGK